MRGDARDTMVDSIEPTGSTGMNQGLKILAEHRVAWLTHQKGVEVETDFGKLVNRFLLSSHAPMDDQVQYALQKFSSFFSGSRNRYSDNGNFAMLGSD